MNPPYPRRESSLNPSELPLTQSLLHNQGKLRGLKRLSLFYYNTQLSNLSTNLFAVVFLHNS